MLYFNQIKDIDNIIFNNTNIDTLVFNNVIVWRKPLFIYNLGNECDNVTGGYGYIGAQAAILPSGSGWNDGTEWYKNSNCLHLGIPDDPLNRIGGFYTAAKIDITNYNKLYVLVDIYMGNTEIDLDIGRYVSIIIGDDLYYLSPNHLAGYHWYNTWGSTYQTILEVDVSYITGNHRIQFYAIRDAHYGEIHYRMDFKIYKAWLSY